MSSSEVPREWVTKLANHKLIRTSNVLVEADRNMLVFSLAEMRSTPSIAHAISQFLMKAFQEFCLKAARLQFDGWFYAWYDEMSGTLRCSASSVLSSAELPFSCQIDVVDTAAQIADAVATSKYIKGIPATELQEVQQWDGNISPPEFRLPVFARPLIRPI
jgi:hypothetical protein